MTAQTTQPASLPWLEKLIAFPTISGTSNLELIELIEAEFARYGYSGVRTYNEDRTRANLLVTIPAADGTTRGGLILSGHTDVVPVAGQAWDADPFTLRVEGTRAYGRGVCDMKGFLAVALWLLPRVAEAKLRTPLHFAFSYDEEMRPPSSRSSWRATSPPTTRLLVSLPACALSPRTRVRTAAASPSPACPSTAPWQPTA